MGIEYFAEIGLEIALRNRSKIADRKIIAEIAA